jgi:hypothetical protein
MAIDMISGWIPYSKDLKRFIAFWSSQSTPSFRTPRGFTSALDGCPDSGAARQHLALTVRRAVTHLAIASRHPGEGPHPLRDLDQIRASLTGAGPIAIVDLPWIPVFLFICFLIHPLAWQRP